ncbi:MAG: hypothetical protein U9R19_11060, partial [Bacteroidota bacterium]|nr:hypothetical protein [Bacteroidota bacterium]
YNWTTGDTSQTLSIVPLSTAYYSLTVSDMACTASDTVLVEVVPLPLVDIGADTIICVKDTVILDAGNPGASYLWSNSDTAQSIEIYPIIPQFIWVDVSQNGCSTIDSFYVDVFPDPIADIGNDTSVCIGESLILNAGTPGCTYFWSTGESSQEILISSPDFYNVEIYNQCNEFDEDTIYVGQFQLPLVNLGNDTSVNFGDTISLDAGGGFLSYNWSNGLNGQIVLLDTGILLPGLNSISVLITDSNFCTNSDTLLITYQTSQIISLPQGWSIISTYIDPVDPNVELVMSSLMPNLIIAKNGSGNVYWPLYSLNGIGNIIIGEGYQIHMTSLDILEVLGTEIVPENTPFPISQGWSIIGYLRNSPAPADSLLAPIVNYIVIVKNSNGMIYWPIFGLNNIGNMNPGEGYQIKMVAPVNFTYQAN